MARLSREGCKFRQAPRCYWFVAFAICTRAAVNASQLQNPCQLCVFQPVALANTNYVKEPAAHRRSTCTREACGRVAAFVHLDQQH